jgi:tetratricopeptide (TPR) repeat protein
VLQLRPELSGVLNNLGITLYEKGEPEEAERCFLRSLEIDSDQNNAYINLAKSCRDQRRVADAEEALLKALELYPEQPEIHWDLSLALLELGKFEEGWKEYEWRLKGGGTMSRDFPIAAWNGEDIRKKTILVTAEQGIGDEIMFSSCFPDLIDCAEQVIIDCEARLAPLFSRSFAKAMIHSSRQADDISWLSQIPTPDVHISAGSLPRYFRNSLQDFPKHCGYLIADTDEISKWHHRYRELGQKRNIGISWKGGHISQAKKRSSAIEDWKSLLKLPDINFINLQYGDVGADIEKASDLFGIKIHHWQDSDPLKNMDQFAAQIAALDLVISVDNSTAHLAGALGVETWVIQPFAPDWRWMGQSIECHWYPSIRQFHPVAPQDWVATIKMIKKELEILTS